MKRIKYTCKKCNWTASVVEAWADMKPIRCANKKCKTSFLKNPEQLYTEMPKKYEEKNNKEWHKDGGRETSEVE